jgi:hypothetical protein
VTGQAWCISAFLVETFLYFWFCQKDPVMARHCDILAAIWLAAAIIIGSLK